jgi:hypothetical protein
MRLIRSRLVSRRRSGWPRGRVRVSFRIPAHVRRLRMHRSSQRPRCRHRGRSAMIRIEALLRVVTRCLNVPGLNRSRSDMPLAREATLFRGWLMSNPIRSTGVRNTAIIHNSRVVDHRTVHISVVDYRRIHANNSGVVSKMASTPFAANEPDAHVTKSVVHAPVVADMRSPIARVEDVSCALKTPVRRSPEISRLRSRHPRTRYPVIASFSVSPIAGRPKVPIRWA